MKSDSITIQDKRTNFRMIEVKSENIQEESEKILSLFDDNSYREEEIFLTRTNSKSITSISESLLTFTIILTLNRFYHVTKISSIMYHEDQP